MSERGGAEPDGSRRARRAAKAAGAAGLALGLRRLFRRRGRAGAPGGTPEPEGPRLPVSERPGEATAVSRHRDDPGERRASRRIAALLLLSTASGLGLLVLYALGGQTQLEGALIAITLGGMGFALIQWGKHLFPHEVVTEDREPHESEAGAQRIAEDLIAQTEADVTRRRFLTRLLIGAAGAFGLALVFPIRSLGPSPGGTLFHTAWRRGKRLLDETGDPVRVDTLPVDGVVTVFPEGHVGDATAQAILVRVEPDQLRLPAGNGGWAPDGNVCYSKLCTHAGCPVGLYLATYHRLQCPCHQSAFDVLDGASVVFGPATRPLPQLPIEADDQGFLVALGDFSAPVGPGFWNRGDGP
jgi:ubiquinol-cytochrome c reductase iron-sulfur subunit